MDAAIQLVSVTKRFGRGAPAVGDLSLAIAEGEVCVLVGPSGCGKTTTLKMINRLIEPTSGQILVNGKDGRGRSAHELRREIGYVIQQIGLFPHRTVRDNIATVPRLLGWEKGRTEGRVTELVDLVGLERDMLGRYPIELSGGQQQRVGVARALAADPPILLMDEPFGAVDPIVRGRLQDLLIELQAEVRKTIVLVTHDIDEAIKLGDRIALLNVGGVLEQYAPPDQMLAAPANDFVAGFLGRERGLKRLSLAHVGDLALDRGPVVAPGSSPDEARAVMAREGTDWVAVVDADRLLGWLPAAEVNDGRQLRALTPRPFKVSVASTSSLREALDAVVTSRTRVAVVSDGPRYLGMLTLERITEEIVS